MGSNTIIEITEDNLCKITTKNERGIKINKYVTFNTMLNLLNASLSEEHYDDDKSNVILSDILPGDSMISTIQVKEILSSNSKWYVLLREKVPANINLKGKIFKNVAMPRTLYAIKVCNNKCVSFRIACVKEGQIKNKTTIYRYPYSNVFDTRSVCLGSNSISDFTLNDLSNIVMIPEMFLAMINNNDGYAGSNSSGLRYEELLEVMENSKFDEDILVESYNTVTYEEFIKNLR